MRGTQLAAPPGCFLSKHGGCCQCDLQPCSRNNVGLKEHKNDSLLSTLRKMIIWPLFRDTPESGSVLILVHDKHSNLLTTKLLVGARVSRVTEICDFPAPGTKLRLRLCTRPCTPRARELPSRPLRCWDLQRRRG